ncbi:IclR family transcriptional regulator [Natronosalvus halobius]|uniref:IclR family transcriptional regulator n=1 Tax=Natronosalvus halobius TaxID=2953746 RepID=UPI00209F1E2F|nr:IclR family transcriptional regulator [Natronosalvus halobius]USZ72240.1 IclR family transcriptional regulator [Natronosalvus halobius]
MPEAKNPVRAVQRSLDIIDILRDTGGARVTDVARDIGVSKGTAHCHLATLEERGYVINENGEYKLGLRFIDVAHHAKNRIDIYDIATTEVDALAEESGEMALFTVEEDGKGICLHTARGAKAVQTEIYVGYRNALYHTAVGKAMLAFMPVKARDRLIQDMEFEALTPNTITGEEALRTELETIRESGIAYNHGETIQGLVGVGAPIRDQDGTIYGAISIIGPERRMNEERLETEIPEMIRRAVNIIEINITSL